MPLHHFLPPHPTTRGERQITYGRPRELALAPSGLEDRGTAIEETTETLRQQHLRKTFDILHLSLLRGDGPRAARALRILVRAKEWRDTELWRYGLAVAGLMAHTDGTSTSSGGQEPESSRSASTRAREEAVATRRLAYLRGLHRTKPNLRVDILADIVYELIQLRRYEEAMREIEYVLDTHPFRTIPTLHLLAGILTLDSGLQALDDSLKVDLTSALAELPPNVRRAAEHHFQRTLTAARKDEADMQLGVQARVETRRRQCDKIEAMQLADLEKHLPKQRDVVEAQEEAAYSNVPQTKSRKKPGPPPSTLSLQRAELKYTGPLKWAVRLAREGKMPDSDVDDDIERASQDSAISDSDDSETAIERLAGRGGADTDVEMGDAGAGSWNADRDNTDPGVDSAGVGAAGSTEEEAEENTRQNCVEEIDEEDDEEYAGDETAGPSTKGKTPSALTTAARLLEGWSKTEAAQRPATWETEAAHLYLTLLQSTSS